jgi:hypothetical protein
MLRALALYTKTARPLVQGRGLFSIVITQNISHHCDPPTFAHRISDRRSQQ